ncbi:MAG: DNA-directed RNA polymerase subunit beta' [Rickettsiales bacterium]|jgi:DNA-directed RNA polymerase subunit beta'|nr:DNA-directed RNA polymerase subunit beta' [Rickettsiales bacterium]
MANDILKKVFGQIETKEQFDSVRISIASPEEILSWSRGEVKKPETINYHSMRPEPEGLFCQKIFGPVKDYECACGKYKRIKFRGLVCERCGVEVTDSKVRRERMGHIKLAIPVSHTWFLREGKVAALLGNMPQKKLESVIYYDAYIVTEPGLTSLKLYEIISEEQYQDALVEFGEDAFHVGIGAEGIRDIISAMDMGDERKRLRAELVETKSETKRRGIVKHLKLVESFLDSNSRPEWMLPDVLPVIPPDMRPLVTLEAGHVATSDLNDLYRRVIIRNNRLKKLQDLHAPEIIIRNEKRMLQEAVDALFDNGHKARPLVSQNRRPLKSLSDSLRGKSGRFRMNMLGKRVDYSGRSVIVSGPTLKLHEVGLPKTMALELFKPFVFARLMAGGYANTLKAARKMVEAEESVVWDILEKVVYQHPVLLNRAPTLHRLSILAFEPILIEGKAIRLHPLVCKGFNADFDGDQMSVYVPISLEAQLEARTLMLSSNNVLSPASGQPMIVPSQDMILGCYYISLMDGEHNDKSPTFADIDEVQLALHNKAITLHTPIIARWNGERVKTTAGRMILGDLLPKKDGVNFEWVNQPMNKSAIEKLLISVYDTCGDHDMIILADQLKNTGFEQGARSGISIGHDDIVIPEEKEALIKKAEKDAAEIEAQYQNGLLSRGERHNKLIDMWGKVMTQIGNIAFSNLRKSTGTDWNSIIMMADSGARGSKLQIQQIAGIRGLTQKPDGSIIEVPIISSFKEGLTMAEYFNSTHGTRKGMSDVALRTAEAGYLTRRLVELAQNSIITEHDCGTDECITATPVYNGSSLLVSLGEIVLGRTAAKDIVHPATKEIIVPAGELISKASSKEIDESGLASVDIRSVLTCKSDGPCAKCYGMDLSRGTLVHTGEAVGVIAGQSVGEPGTQLTLRTFHMGGVADTSGGQHFIETPVDGTVRFDAKIIVNSAGRQVVLSRNAQIKIVDKNDNQIFVTKLPYAAMLVVSDGDMVSKGDKLVELDPYANVIIAEVDGIVHFSDMVENLSYFEEFDPLTGVTMRKITNWKTGTKKSLNPKIVLKDEDGNPISLGNKKIAEYMLPIYTILNVGNGAKVSVGDVLARIPVETQKTRDITGGLPQVENLLEVRMPKNPAILAEIDGEVEFEDNNKQKITLRINPTDGSSPIEYLIPKGTNILVRAGDEVKKGDYLVNGEYILQDVLRIMGEKALAQILVEKVQEVYRLQGVVINNKHIEILIREMLRRVEITDPGDTKFLTGQVVDSVDFEEENARIVSGGGNPAIAGQVLVGLTRASLTSRSFLSNASFQQTTKVLVDAAISGSTDRLAGINENLIVGRLIPVGTGAYVRRIREIAKEEERVELLAAQNANGEQQTLDI